ncbi:hypothetical protein XA68_14799 [Ophiocordyceps unilateralis]|uniref:C2H2-type domain-containing protein n=1 Tax=Ophiocordyceps unilateralis TaxID=268505 RepID=A0A2A9P9V3_OPHUN|nr:hypothetical protein XA68_14799 [Ophiocordyceps unilateralis]
MASLKNIMNVDDDHPLKTPRESVPRFSQHPEPSASTSNLANQHDPSTSSSPSARAQIQTPSSHSSHPEAAPSSTLPLGFHLGYGPDIAAPARLQTATGSDSMDHSYDRDPSHAHMGVSYPGAPSRPFVPTKLTPITGRVSRAKKGLAVHTCELCRPPKTFTRAEHLRRHQLSHQPPGLPCQVPGCDKVFHRKDLLERHQQRHDQEERLAGGAGRRSMSRPHGSASPARSSLEERTSRAPVTMAPPFGSPPLGSRPTSAPGGPGRPLGHGNWSVAGSSSPPMRHVQQHFGPKSTTPECLMDPMPMDALPQTEAPVFKPDSESALELINVPGLCTPQVGSEPSLVSWPSDHAVVRSAPSSNYSTPPPSDSSHLDQPAARSSTAAWAESLEPSAVSSRMLMDHGSYPLTSMGYNSSPPQAYSTSSYGDTAGMAFPGFDDSLYGSPVAGTVARSLSPQVAVGQCSETLVTAPAALPGDRMLHAVSCGLPPETTFGLLTAEGLMPPLSEDVVRSMPRYLDLYWEKVHPMYPIIHRATFEEASGVEAEHMDVLRCAMAAVATQFLGHREHRINGSQLHGYAWRMSEDIVGLLPNSVNWPLPVMQAVLLCEYYARFRGRSKEAYRPSPRFNKLCQMVASSQPVCEGKKRTRRSSSWAWRSWIGEESRRRLLAACFLLSVHGNWYYEQPLTADLGLDKFSPMMLPVSLSANSTRAWEAAEAESWAALKTASKETQMVGDVLQQQLTASDMEAMPSFDASILLAAHALQLPRRRKHTEVEVMEDPLRAMFGSQTMMRLFPQSAVAYVYLALHHTPLHCLLSVSGDSWVFNSKVSQASFFQEHQHKLDRWRTSGSAAAATLSAAKALKLFLGLDSRRKTATTAAGAWRDISDFWGVYVCALICWAAAGQDKSKPATRASATRWILTVASAEVQTLSGREGSRGVIGLARDVLEKDCLGGRSILFADAVGVLRKLDEGDGWRY